MNIEDLQLQKLKVLSEALTIIERVDMLAGNIRQLFAMETMNILAMSGEIERSTETPPPSENDDVLEEHTAGVSVVELEEVDEQSEGSINYSESAPLEYDSDIEKDNLECDDEDIIEFKNDSPCHKMQTAIQTLQTFNLDALKAYLEENHRDIRIHPRSTLNSLSDALLQELYRTASERQIVATMGDVRHIINAQTDVINQKAKRFGQLRKILKERFGEESKIVKKHYRFGISHEEHNLKQQVSKSNRKERLENRIQVTDKEVQEILHKHSASDDVFDQVIAVMLATGSRIIEALRLSKFKRSDRGEDWIHITELAKKKEPVGINRPLIGLDADEFLELVKEMRKNLKKRYPDYDQLSNDDLTKKVDARVNSRIKKMGLDGVDGSHTLRKFWAQFTYKMLPAEERKKLDPHQYIQNFLVHNSIDTSASYANVKISKGGVKIKGQQDIEKKFDVVDKKDAKQDQDIDALEQKVDACKGNTVELKNTQNDKVKVLKHSNNKRGVALVRLEEVMRDLHSKGVKITEAVLKKQFNFGSKTISELKDLKRQLNESLLGERAVGV